MALAERSLIHSDPEPDHAVVPACHTPINRPAHDPVDHAPVQAELTGHRTRRHLAEPVDRRRLEQRGEGGTQLRPQDNGEVNVVLRAVNAGNLGRGDRPVPAGAQVTPFPAAAVVARARLPRHRHAPRHLTERKFDPADPSRGLNAQDFPMKFAVTHCSDRPIKTSPTGFSPNGTRQAPFFSVESDRRRQARRSVVMRGSPPQDRHQPTRSSEDPYFFPTTP